MELPSNSADIRFRPPPRSRCLSKLNYSATPSSDATNNLTVEREQSVLTQPSSPTMEVALAAPLKI